MAAEPAGAETPAPGGPARPRSRSAATLVTSGTVVVVLVVVVVLLILKVTSPGTPTQPTVPVLNPAPAGVVQEATSIPASVYDAVGVNSPASTVTPPTVLAGQPPLTVRGRPALLYVGSEYCPYCAAQGWAVVAALSRFGHFGTLGQVSSSPTAVFAGTQGFTFYRASYHSRYLTAELVEQQSDVIDPLTGNYTTLQSLTPAERLVVGQYATTKYLPGSTSVSGVGPVVPFVDVGNRVVASASYSPSILSGLTRDQIAADLQDPTNPVTQAIVASANYLTAAICATDGQAPRAVCTSRGVVAATTALGSRG